MKRKILINDRELIYEFLRKNIKNINLRIRNDGSVLVSAPQTVSSQTVEKFINSRSKWIFKHLDRLNKSLKENTFELKNGALIPVFDKKYVLTVKIGKGKSCYIENDKFTVSLPDPSNTKMIQNLLISFLEDTLKERLELMCSNIYEKDFRQLNVSYPEIYIRKMRSRWGSCHSQNNKIIFNKQLIFLPTKCVEYIIYHEFTHFIHPNHSKEFYQTLNSFLPDLYERKSELKKHNSVINIAFLE